MFCLLFEVLDQYKIFEALTTCSVGGNEERKMIEWYYLRCKLDIQKSKLIDELMCIVLIIVSFVMMFVIMSYEIPDDYWYIRYIPSFICFSIAISRMTIGRYLSNKADALYAAYLVFIATKYLDKSDEEQTRA